MTNSLAGRVALITGAGQGVGKEIALVLGGLGAAIAVNDLNPDRAAAVVAELDAAGIKAVAAVGDVSDAASVAAFVANASELGTVDIVVNNAGIPAEGMGRVAFVDSTPELWRRFIDINVYGVANVIHAVLPGMTERGWGRIITISSDSARMGDPYIAMYAASKAAAAALTRSLAAEVGRDGITCNSLSLGTIQSPAMDEELAGKLSRHYPAGRLGRPSDIAAAVAFLVSDGAEWVTGQTIPINGGSGRS